MRHRWSRLLVSVVAAGLIVSAAGRGHAASSWVVAGGGTWVVANHIVRQTAPTTIDPKKYVLSDLQTSGDQAITALVRVDSFPHVESRAGLALRTNVATGDGFNFVLLDQQRVGFLADEIAFGSTCSYAWTPGQWYWLKFAITGSNLTGKIWAKDQTEADATTCQQSGWSQFASGAPGLNGGSFGETVSFDSVQVGTLLETFDSGAPLAAEPPAGYLTRRQLLTKVQSTAQTEAFNLTGFVNLLHATGNRLICPTNEGLCENYATGTFAVVPSPFYRGGTWMRDAAWTLGGLNDAVLMSALTSRFAGAMTNEGRMPTLLINASSGALQPWYGAGGQGNPLPDDDSNFMYAIAARLGWQPVTQLESLNGVYAWMRNRTAGDGWYLSTSHGWHDSFYPLGTSGTNSATVVTHMQGLYAVALRALKDLGVAVPQSEVDAANANYAALTVNGRMRAYAGSDRVGVTSLIGDALSLYIWNQPLLPDAVVEQTIANFAEVFDQQSRFVGYKVISEASGAFLPPGDFPVENGGAGTGAGDYQNGGSWLLYDAFALYAGIRHNLPDRRDAYATRLVQRFAAELRAGVGTVPANKSNEFLCTAPAGSGAPCSPTGSAVPERADYGWNAFLLRLLSDEDPPPSTGPPPPPTCPVVAPGGSSTCPMIGVSPTTLRFAAVKAGAGGAITAVTPPQVITVQMPGTSSGWSAVSNQPWLQLTNASGAGSGQFTIAVSDAGNSIGAATSASATIRISPASDSVSAVDMSIQLTVNQTGGGTSAPLGQVDTPSQGAVGVVGAIGVTGWVIDDVGVASVKVYRGCLAAEPQNCQNDVLSGQSLVYIGDAVFVPGARPDVEAGFPNYPARHRAGWGFAVLTNMLPRATGTYASTGGQGPVTLYAIATDVEGNRRLLGRAYTDTNPAPTTITLDNDTIAKPFGTLDTPAQGSTVSGTIVSFGWALTPDANTTAGSDEIRIDPSGASIVVYLDGLPLGTVAFDQCRGNVGNPVPPGAYCNDDIASAFGHLTPQAVLTPRTSNPTRFRNLDAGRAAIAAFAIDTRTLSNGLHSIAWSVTDSAGRVEGIGSRQFTVLNGTTVGRQY
jgi:hypothetical protein